MNGIDYAGNMIVHYITREVKDSVVLFRYSTRDNDEMEIEVYFENDKKNIKTFKYHILDVAVSPLTISKEIIKLLIDSKH